MFNFMFTATSIFITLVALVIFISVFINLIKQFKNRNIVNSDTPKNTQQKQHGSNLKDCIYCGSPVKIDETECESCGGKEFKKHN